jgi:putative transposase
MLKTLDECRWLYNHLLEMRKSAYETTGKGLTLYGQQATFSGLKSERPSLTSVHSQVLQNVAVRIDLGFKAFFRRAKAGEKPGYPRFRGRGLYDSFCYPQAPSGCQINKDTVYLSKIGNVKLILHRPLVGKPKTVCIQRTSTGKWFACISCETEPEPLPPTEETMGIDVGLTNFATLSNGERINNPHFFRQDEQALAKAQRLLSKETKGTPACAKRRKAVSRIHERIANRRRDFAHQESRKIVNRFGVIAVEDLSVYRLVHNHHLSKSILDAAWSEFAQFLSYKAENAGREFIAVNPAYTSQDCSNCGYRQVMPLSDRVYLCPECGLSLDRDHNAALNIIARGLTSIGYQSVEAPAFPTRGE